MDHQTWARGFTAPMRNGLKASPAAARPVRREVVTGASQAMLVARLEAGPDPER